MILTAQLLNVMYALLLRCSVSIVTCLTLAKEVVGLNVLLVTLAITRSQFNTIL